MLCVTPPTYVVLMDICRCCPSIFTHIFTHTTGEFGQEQALLGSSYQVHECRAALTHLGSSNVFGAALSSVLSALLGVR